MSCTDRLRHQQNVATIMTCHLRNLVRRHRPGDNAIAIATQLARLLRVLRVHLAEEDEYLYPALIAIGDRNTAALAERYQAEMGSLAVNTEVFMQRWSSSAVIALNFAAFETALDLLLGALMARMECENAALYPVADGLLPDLRVKAA